MKISLKDFAMRRKRQKEEISSKVAKEDQEDSEEPEGERRKFVPIQPAKSVDTSQAKQETVESKTAGDGEMSNTHAGSSSIPPLPMMKGRTSAVHLVSTPLTEKKYII